MVQPIGPQRLELRPSLRPKVQLKCTRSQQPQFSHLASTRYCFFLQNWRQNRIMGEEKLEPTAMEGLSRQQSAKVGEVQDPANQPGHDLHKRLETRHVTMIALGGALGTGLLIGT